MASEWIDAKLGDYIDSCLGKMLDKNKNKGEFYPYLGNSNVRWGAFDLDELGQMKFEDHEHVRYGIKAGDLIVCEGGEPGRCAIWEDDLPNMKIQKALHRVRTLDGLDSEFIYYWFLLAGKNKLLDAYFTGTTIKHLTGKALKEIPIKIPPLKHQMQVAVLLRSFDKKIKTNRQINQTLEQMAQAIFKSWFVDFDPVKTKMNGEQPIGIDAATASLFPGKLVESELGLIPEGWEVSTLSSLIQLTGGGTPKRSEETYWNGDIPWFSVRDVPSGSNVFVVDTDEKITELGLNKSSTKLLPKGTTIITARGTVGKLALVGTDMCMNQSCYGIRGKEVGDFYNYFNLNEAVSTLQRNTHGAIFDTITTKTFDTYSMAFGGVELANKFDSIVAPLLQKIEANVRQNIELATLRDTLLPKLLSGEIDLENVQVEAAKAIVE
ncbi:restriction endonuclease subunit S [Vibrio lentus]